MDNEVSSSKGSSPMMDEWEKELRDSNPGIKVRLPRIVEEITGIVTFADDSQEPFVVKEASWPGCASVLRHSLEFLELEEDASEIVRFEGQVKYISGIECEFVFAKEQDQEWKYSERVV